MTESTYAAESGHWYTKDGTPAYEVLSAKGEPRPTTLRDARKLGLYPSVTAIIKSAAQPGLEIWKQRQVLMAALTLPRQVDEPDAAYIARVLQDSKEEAKAAADQGTRVHASIEGFYLGEPDIEYPDAAEAFREAAHGYFGERAIGLEAKTTFAHPLGYGGMLDLHNPSLVLDVKTKDDVEGVELYEEHYMQLAAYRQGVCLPEARCAIAFMTRAAPWTVRIIEADPRDLARGWEMFRALLAYWQARTGHRPA